MELLYNILTVIFVILSLVLTVVVLMQEGKSAGLTSTITGGSDSYYSKNKGNTPEGKMIRFTKLMAVLFFVLAIVLNLKFWN